ncbi:MAG: SCP2 sterol-binding domain-containing protein [Ekhidna sp.]|nr:SCP2 sterol-binding domain-containing protein [Ekhidna sp.]
MTLDEVQEKIQKLADEHTGQLGGKANFKFEDGIIHLDDTTSPTVVVNEEREAPFTIKMKVEDFSRILSGSLNIMKALMTGKIKIEGDKSAAIKLTKLF